MQGAELPLDARLYPFVLALFAALCVGVAIFAARFEQRSRRRKPNASKAALPEHLGHRPPWCSRT
jgi:hypothetical protein